MGWLAPCSRSAQRQRSCCYSRAQGKITDALLQRLVLKPQKIAQLADGIRAIAGQEEPVGQLLKRTEVRPIPGEIQ